MGIEFNDVLEVNTQELPKLPKEKNGTQRCDWMKFLSAKRREDFEMIAESNPSIGKAVAKVMELSEDEYIQ